MDSYAKQKSLLYRVDRAATEREGMEGLFSCAAFSRPDDIALRRQQVQ